MTTSTYDSVTEPLKSGDPLPAHPDDTTARRITGYGPVYDADDGRQLMAGLHRAEVSMLMNGERILEHAYRYAILDRHIYHTRRGGVVIHVVTEPTDEPV